MWRSATLYTMLCTFYNVIWPTLYRCDVQPIYMPYSVQPTHSGIPCFVQPTSVTLLRRSHCELCYVQHTWLWCMAHIKCSVLYITLCAVQHTVFIVQCTICNPFVCCPILLWRVSMKLNNKVKFMVFWMKHSGTHCWYSCLSIFVSCTILVH